MDIGSNPVYDLIIDLCRTPNERDIEAIHRLKFDKKTPRETVREVQNALPEFFDAVVPDKKYRRSTEDQEEGILVEVARYGDTNDELYVAVAILCGQKRSNSENNYRKNRIT
mgnify:CR=1 FL=1